MKELTAAEYNALVESTMSEAVWGTHLVGTARFYGFLVTHFRASRAGDAGERWATAIEGDDGYPDLTLTNGKRLLIVEAKSAKGRLYESQHGWLTLLSAVGGVEVDVWRPSDHEYVQQIFQGMPVDPTHLGRELSKPTVANRPRGRRGRRGKR